MLNKTIKKFVNENKSYSYNWYNFNNNDDDNNINLYHKFFKQFYYEMNNNEAFISNIDVNISRLLSQNQLINEEEKIINSITSEEVQEKIFSNNLNLKNFKFKKILESRYKLGMLVNIMFGKDIIPKNESIKTNFLDKKTFSTLIYKMGYKINNEYEDIWNILEYYKCLKKTIMDNDEFKEKFNIDKLSDFIDKLESKKGNQNDFYSFLQDKISKNNKSKNKKYIKVKDDNYKQKYVQFIEFVNKFCEINKFNWKLDNKKFLFKKYKIYQPLIYSQFLLGNYKDSKFKLFYNDTFEIHDDTKSDKYVKIKIDKNISIKELNNNFSNSMNMINNIFIKLYIDQEKEISFSEYLENLKNIDIQIIKFKENLFMLEADMFNFLNENEIESKMTNKNGAQYIEFSKYKHIYNDTNITNSKIKKIYNDFNQLQKDRNALLHIDFNYHNITNKIIEYIKSK